MKLGELIQSNGFTPSDAIVAKALTWRAIERKEIATYKSFIDSGELNRPIRRFRNSEKINTLNSIQEDTKTKGSFGRQNIQSHKTS